MNNSNNLEVLRSTLGLTNRDFAKLIGIHETMYTKIKGGDPVGEKTINKIKRAFPKYNYQWILFNTGEMFITIKQENIFNSSKIENMHQVDNKDLLIELLKEKLNNVTSQLHEAEQKLNPKSKAS